LTDRFIRANCWRRARFSMAISEDFLNIEQMIKNKLSSFIMGAGFGRMLWNCQWRELISFFGIESELRRPLDST